MPVVRVIESAVVYDHHVDVMVPLRQGDAYDSDDPVVKQHPSMFSADNSRVESASAAPGEKRTR